MTLKILELRSQLLLNHIYFSQQLYSILSHILPSYPWSLKLCTGRISEKVKSFFSSGIYSLLDSQSQDPSTSCCFLFLLYFQHIVITCKRAVKVLFIVQGRFFSTLFSHDSSTSSYSFRIYIIIHYLILNVHFKTSLQ